MARKHKATAPTALTEKHSLVYISRLSSQEKAAIFRAGGVLLAPQLQQNFKNCVTKVVIDRLIRAENLLKLATRLVNPRDGLPPSEEELRGAVGRAYYSIHHSIRSMALYHSDYDPDGHEESIKLLVEMLKDNAFSAKTQLKRTIGGPLNEARENRSIADYSPYDMSKESNSTRWMLITAEDWEKAATFNIEPAEKMLEAAMRLVGLI